MASPPGHYGIGDFGAMGYLPYSGQGGLHGYSQSLKAQNPTQNAARNNAGAAAANPAAVNRYMPTQDELSQLVMDFPGMGLEGIGQQLSQWGQLNNPGGNPAASVQATSPTSDNAGGFGNNANAISALDPQSVKPVDGSIDKVNEIFRNNPADEVFAAQDAQNAGQQANTGGGTGAIDYSQLGSNRGLTPAHQFQQPAWQSNQQWNTPTHGGVQDRQNQVSQPGYSRVNAPQGGGGQPQFQQMGQNPYAGQNPQYQNVQAQGQNAFTQNSPGQYGGQNVGQNQFAGQNPQYQNAQGAPPAWAMPGGGQGQQQGGQWNNPNLGQTNAGLNEYGQGTQGLNRMANQQAGDNPYLNEHISNMRDSFQKSFDDRNASLGSMFSGSGRTGSGAHFNEARDLSEEAGQQFGQLETGMRSQAYDADMNRRLAASGQLGSLGLNRQNAAADRNLRQYQTDSGANVAKYGIDTQSANQQNSLDAATRADLYKAQMQNSLGRYGIDAGLISDRMQDSTARAGLNTALDQARMQDATSRYGIDSQTGLGQYGIDAQQALGQYQTDAGLISDRMQSADTRAGLDTQRYGIDSDLSKARMQDATNRYGIGVNQELGKYGIDAGMFTSGMQDATNRYGIDVGSRDFKYGTDSGANVAKYGTDAQTALGRYQTDMQGQLGQMAAANQRFGMESGHQLGGLGLIPAFQQGQLNRDQFTAQLGQMSQADQQAALDAARAKHEYGENTEWDLLNKLKGIMEGVPTESESSGTSTSRGTAGGGGLSGG